jgi:hypothetical protein
MKAANTSATGLRMSIPVFATGDFLSCGLVMVFRLGIPLQRPVTAPSHEVNSDNAYDSVTSAKINNRKRCDRQKK